MTPTFPALRHRLSLFWLALCLVLAAGLPGGVRADAAAATERVLFDIRSDFPSAEVRWVKPFLRRSLETVDGFFNNELTRYPERIRVTLRRDARLRGLKGSANRGRNELRVTTNLWQEDRYRRWIVLHELVNLLVAHYGSPGGYPSDWWSNGSSPFPLFVTGAALRRMGYADDAVWLREAHGGRPDHELYWVLHERYGMGLFRRFFRLLKRDGVELGDIGERWPRPDRRRALYTLGYLSLAAGENLAPLARRWGVGERPADWRKRHPEIPFVPYVVGDEEVERFMALRRRLFGPDRPAGDERERFLGGEHPLLSVQP